MKSLERTKLQITMIKDDIKENDLNKLIIEKKQLLESIHAISEEVILILIFLLILISFIS